MIWHWITTPGSGQRRDLDIARTWKPGSFKADGRRSGCGKGFPK
jgi:hypothetical protein